jgi:hypothetical protein
MCVINSSWYRQTNHVALQLSGEASSNFLSIGHHAIKHNNPLKCVSLVCAKGLRVLCKTQRHHAITANKGNYMLGTEHSWDANSCSTSQDIPHLLGNPTIHNRVDKNLPQVPNLFQTNPVHTAITCFLKILMLSSHLRLYSGEGKNVHLISPPILPRYLYWASLLRHAKNETREWIQVTSGG